MRSELGARILINKEDNVPSKQANILIVLLSALIVLLPVLIFLVGLQFFPTKWEYTIVSPSDYRFDIKMNKLGEDGWEIVNARRATSKWDDSVIYEMILKRPSSNIFQIPK